MQLQAGMTITQSVIIKKAVYRLPSTSDDGSQSVIAINGSNITVDFNGAELVGTPEDTPPDQRRGTALRVTGSNITIKNVSVRGYKIGLIARDAPLLRILDSDFSYNWKQHLKSTLEREDEADWMSYHHNEKDEWLRYGGGIYLRRADGFEVKNVTIEGGQNGLMLMESNRGLVWNSRLAFLSSIGLALYRSSENRVMHNRIDWCVRGYSHGVYNRGQDSAGILIYEQSNRNVFAYNSVTHGGDGFFLWAGQTTMDTGMGGCNGNLVYGNDFSHAPTNGIEATFSRNDFVNNLVLECWHGVWGGYSYASKFLDNRFGLNAQGIAIEHGQDNTIAYNVFHRDNEAVVLWKNKTQDPDWGYPKHHDTDSHDYSIAHNLFSHITLQALRIRATSNVTLTDNLFKRNAKIFNVERDATLRLDGNKMFGPPEKIADAPNITTLAPDEWSTAGADAAPPLPATMQANGQAIVNASDDYLKRFATDWSPWLEELAADKRQRIAGYAPAPLAGGMNPFLQPEQRRGRRYILVDEWGPYDFKSPVLWPRGKPSAANASGQADAQRFEILGPKGRWRLLALRGVEWISARTGRVPGFVDVRLSQGKAGDVSIELEYTGAAVVSPFGARTAKGKPYRFGYAK